MVKTTVTAVGDITSDGKGWKSVKLILGDGTSGIVINRDEGKLKFNVGDPVVYSKQDSHFSGAKKYVGMKKETAKRIDSPQGIKAVRHQQTEYTFFFDIETVPALEELPNDPTDPTYMAWEYQRRKDNETTYEQLAASYREKAGLFSEYNKIVCVSTGYFDGEKLKVRSFYGYDEKKLLQEFANTLDKAKGLELCGHYIKGFDIPTCYKRMLVHGIEVPDKLDVAGEKPWLVKAIDVSEIWKGPSLYPSSLTAVCLALGIPTSKTTNVDGSKIAELYYKGGDTAMNDIVEYCERDVLAVANIFRRMKYQPLIEEIART